MKVTLQKDYRGLYTLDDVERAKMVIAYEKENDTETVKSWAEYAVREALKETGLYLRDVLTATASTAMNCRVWDAYGNTADMDVWIEATAETSGGFVKVGAYLTDIWQTGAITYKQHMFIRIATFND